MEPVKWTNVAHKAATLGLEHLPDRLRRLFGVIMSLGIGNAFIEEPSIQFLQAFDPETRREEALAHKADLVLDLTLLPSRCRCAGDRLNEIVAAHLQEAAIVQPLLADKDRLDRRFHIVVDAARAGATEEVEGLVVGVEDHLLALTHIGSGKHHVAVAEADMSDFHRGRHTVIRTISWFQSN